MPMYEYMCNDCGLQFELRQKFSDKPATECPGCGGTVEKMISQTSFALKGSGWYTEGYAKGSSASGKSCGKEGACATCPSAA
jgi:putative FmdB family regulatory protein